MHPHTHKQYRTVHNCVRKRSALRNEYRIILQVGVRAQMPQAPVETHLHRPAQLHAMCDAIRD